MPCSLKLYSLSDLVHLEVNDFSTMMCCEKVWCRLIKTFCFEFSLCLLSNLPGVVCISVVYTEVSFLSICFWLYMETPLKEYKMKDRCFVFHSSFLLYFLTRQTIYFMDLNCWFTSPPALFSWPITLCFALPVVSCNYTKVYFELWIYCLLRSSFKGLVLPFKRFSSMFLAYFNMTTQSKFRQIL